MFLNYKMASSTLLFPLLLLLSSSLQLTQLMTQDDKYITIIANISSFNISSDITVMVEATNASQTPYIVARASFNDTVNDQYSELSFYEKQTPSDIDLQAATFREKQHIHLVKESIDEDTLYMVVYNVNPYFKRETVQITVQVVNEFQCQGCPSSSECTCDSCSSGMFGQHCSHNYHVVYGEVNSKTEMKFSMRKNSFLYFVLDIENEMNINFTQQSGSFQIYSKEAQNLNFPSYLQPAFENDTKLYLLVNKSSSLYGIGNQPKRNLVTIVTYGEDASFKITFERRFSMLATVLLIILLPILLFFLIFAIIAICYCCRRKNQTVPQQNPLNEEYFPNYIYDQILNTINNEGKVSLAKQEELTHAENQHKHQCQICKNTYSPHDIIRVLYCGHFFHHPCLHEWFNNNIENLRCPQCSKSHKANQIALYYSDVWELKEEEQVLEEKKSTEDLAAKRKQLLYCILSKNKMIQT